MRRGGIPLFPRASLPRPPSRAGRGAPRARRGGVGFILNKNFIIAVDYGRAFDRQDNGKGGSLYINTGYLF